MCTRLYRMTAFAFVGLAGCAEISDDTDTTNTAASAVTGADFRLLNGPFTPSTQTVKRGSGTLFDITLESLNGFNGVVSFSATGKPIKTTSNFDPVTLTGSGDETFEIQTIDTDEDTNGGTGTPPGTYHITIIGTSGALSHTVGVTLIVR
jgi:hypothetical protein